MQYALKSLAKNVEHTQILLWADSRAAISYINRYGGCRSIKLNSIAKCICQWCELKNIWIYMSYINTALNKIADAESRMTIDDTDFKLTQESFDLVVCHFGNPTIDLFASHHTAQCLRFISWFPDPGSIGVDAFTIDWSTEFFYAFPPFCLITRVLRKIKSDKARGIVVVPNWKSQPWYPVFSHMVSSRVLELGPSDNLFEFPIPRVQQKIPIRLKLLVAILSENPIR